LLDELAWKNFDDEWEVVAEEVFSEPLRWNHAQSIEDKIRIPGGDRASFSLIAYEEYSIYNSGKKRNEIMTDFWLTFSGDTYLKIGYGSHIRLKITILGKDESGRSFKPVQYYLVAKLLQSHGIPKIDIVEFRRITNKAA
jgi:hypothetical protein